MGAGCNREKAETKLPAILSKPTVGHSYVAALMPTHPLYGELRALQERIDSLRGTQPPALAAQIGQPWESPLLVSPAYDSDIISLGQYQRQWWEDSQPGTGNEPAGLPGDLQARLLWEKDRIDREVQRQLHEAAIRESELLARLQIEAMQRRQGEVSAQELEVGIPADEASEKAEQLRREIVEQAVAEEGRASQVRLRKLREALEQQKREAVAEVQHELESKAKQRWSHSAVPGRELREKLAQRIEEFSEMVELRDGAVSAPSPSASQVGQAEECRESAQEQYQQAISAQVKRLAARQMALTVAIERATRRAARRIAWEENLELHLLPGDARIGEDLTAQVAEKLTAMWTAQKPRIEEGSTR